MQEDKHPSEKPKKWYHSPWLKKLGWAGFLFFLIKGLLWIALALLTYFGLLEL